MKKATFGPGGNGDLFYAEGGKSTIQAPGWVKRYGLDAYEFEAGRGIGASEDTLRKIGEKAREHGVLMSLHTPYYISLSGVDPEKRLKSVDYIQKSLWAAELLGAVDFNFHILLLRNDGIKLNRISSVDYKLRACGVAGALGEIPDGICNVRAVGDISDGGEA